MDFSEKEARGTAKGPPLNRDHPFAKTKPNHGEQSVGKMGGAHHTSQADRPKPQEQGPKEKTNTD